MTFVQLEFVLFFAAVLALYWALPRRRWQNALLLGASGLFYGWVHPWFLYLLYGSATLDYTVTRLMGRMPARRRALLAASVVGNLGLLGYFKYFGFFVDNVTRALEALGFTVHPSTLEIFLPVGISFYTFQTMSYTIDVFRGRVEARSSYLDYLVYVSFFPQLVAGPIERPGSLLPQIETPRRFDATAVASGLTLALWGAVKKICIADVIAPYVDKAFILREPSGPLIWAATLGFAIQILADFSGYTDIARGVSRMLGFELRLNFRHPYVARNPSDFWKRWHISLSTWIRDYLYIPLGGSRGTLQRTLMATYLSMGLAGLWHGAAWTFLLWGLYHATLLVLYRAAARVMPASVRRWPGAHLFSIALMFVFTCVGWMIFRETHLDRLVLYLGLHPFAASPDQWIATVVLLTVVLAAALPLALAMLFEATLLERVARSPWVLPLQSTFWAAAVLAIFVFVRVTSNDFIYFQF